jgi:ActR/RegA family two-component response regulator
MPPKQPYHHPRRFLVIEADGPFQRRLVVDLEAAGPYQVSVARTAGEGCRILKQQPHDLALIPLANSDALIHALRTVQPDLPLVLLADETELAIGQTVPETAQAVLLRSCLQTELPVALEQALAAVPVDSSAEEFDVGLHLLPALDTAAAKELLLELEWPDSIRAALLVTNERPLVLWGTVDSQAAQTIAHQLQAGKEMLEQGALPVQMQFIELADEERRVNALLYTRPVAPEFGAGLLLALVALPRTTVTGLRNQAGAVAGQLHDLLCGSATVAPATVAQSLDQPSTADAPEPASNSFAIVWRAAAPLSDAAQNAIQDRLERIAQANGCLLHHTLVRPDLIHLVVTCPPGRNAAWVVHLFKHGLLAPGQNQATEGVTDAISWARGYYASEDDAPLSEVELNLFLEQDRLEQGPLSQGPLSQGRPR